MTPTLWGRWQSRLWLTIFVGGFITIFFAILYQNRYGPFIVLLYVMTFGFLWDILYEFWQKFHWDRDWPPLYELVAGLWEGLFLWFLILSPWPWQWFGWEALPGIDPSLTELSLTSLYLFWGHYLVVWSSIFFAVHILMRLLYPRLRYFGGQWIYHFPTVILVTTVFIILLIFGWLMLRVFV